MPTIHNPTIERTNTLKIRLLDVTLTLCALMILKLFYLAVAINIAHYNEVRNGKCLKEGPIDLTCLSHLIQRFDSGWYTSLANHGHERFTQPDQFYLSEDGKTPQQSNYAFFPLYPLLVSGLVKISGLDTRIGMLFIAIALSAINAILFFRFALHYLKDRARAYWALAFFFLMPFQFYHHVALTEPLFILGLMLAFSGVLLRQWWSLALGAFIVTLTRPNGVFMGLPLLLFYLQVTQSWVLINNWIRGRTPFSLSQIWPQHWPLLLFFIFPVCFFGYCFYLQYMTSDFFAFHTAMVKGWGPSLDYPWKSFFKKGDFVNQFLSFYTCAYIILASFYAHKMNSAFNTLIAITILLAIMRGELLSVQRFMCILFPFAFIFVDILYRLPEYTQKVLLVVGMFAFHLWCFDAFIQSNWIAC